MSYDPLYNRLIHRSRWIRLRHLVLSRHPLCEVCEREGRITAATEVHHVQPVEESPDPVEKERRMYDVHNLMAVCHACHFRLHQERIFGGRKTAALRSRNQAKWFNRKYYGEDGNDNEEVRTAEAGEQREDQDEERPGEGASLLEGVGHAAGDSRDVRREDTADNGRDVEGGLFPAPDGGEP